MIDINLTDVASETDLNNHVLDTANPHDVTKTQVGLGNVDNTSDVDKPISSATQTALNAKENTLPSIVGNSLKVLRVNAGETAKEWATISTGLTIGTTPITSGVAGRVLFEGAGNVMQEDANFTFDSTLKRLTLKAVGTNATDIPFSVQNSPGTVNLLQQNGVGSILARSNDAFSYAGLFYRTDGANGFSLTNSHSGYSLGTGIEVVGTNGVFFRNNGNLAFRITTQSTGTFKNYGFWNYGSDAGQRLLIGENVYDPQVTLSGTGNLGIGTYTAGARLDIRAQGALSTDIAFRVRNSADTSNLFIVKGNGVLNAANLPISATGLVTGDIWNNGGVLNIV